VSLSSASTYADAVAQYRDNANYDDPSLSSSSALTKATAFREAIRHMLLAPDASAFADSNMHFRPDLWEKQLAKVDDVINTTGGSSSSGGVRKFAAGARN